MDALALNLINANAIQTLRAMAIVSFLFNHFSCSAAISLVNLFDLPMPYHVNSKYSAKSRLQGCQQGFCDAETWQLKDYYAALSALSVESSEETSNINSIAWKLAAI